LTEPENEGGYFKIYNKSIRILLDKKETPYKELILQGNEINRNLSLMKEIKSDKNDIFLLSYAHNPIINFLKYLPGKKFAHAHGLEASIFEPAILLGYELNEEEVFSIYDGIFVNSSWARSIIIGKYPSLAGKIIVSGFPFDPDDLKEYKEIKKEENLIVFNQRFALDKLHIIEVYLGEILVKQGFKVMHLLPHDDILRIGRDREARVLYEEGTKRGLTFNSSKNKGDYYSKLAKAKYVITTPMAETLSLCILEGAALNAIPIAPDWGPFPEYLNPSNLYPPYNIDKILKILTNTHSFGVSFHNHLPHKVFNIYLDAMGVG
jgi:hypothetical protein